VAPLKAKFNQRGIPRGKKKNVKKYELTKTPKKARWTRESEFRSEVLTITRSGEARLTHHNGGWGGAWDPRSYTGAPPEYLSLQEAIAMLEQWGVDEDDIAAVHALQAHLPADLAA